MSVPSNTTPADFFERWIPGEFTRARNAGVTAPEVTFESHLTGDGGGTWTLRVTGGELTVTPGPAASPDLRAEQSVADWRALWIGEDGAPDVFPRDLDLVTSLTRSGSTNGIHLLREQRGTLRLAISGFAGRTWSLTLVFQSAATPAAEVTVDAATMQDLRFGRIDPVSAFFGGKIQLGGDTAWIMQAGMQVAASARR